MLVATLLLALVPSTLAQGMITTPQECATACSSLSEVYTKCGSLTDMQQAMSCLKPMCEGTSYNDLGTCITCMAKYSSMTKEEYWAMFDTICGPRKSGAASASVPASGGDSASTSSSSASAGASAAATNNAAGANLVPVLPAVAGLAVAAALF